MTDCYEKMPKSVRVGCYTFSVERGQEWEHNASNEYGHCNLCSMAIRIHPNLAPQKLANVFLHECLHAIHMVYGLHDGSNEEDFTCQTANGLCAFWQDNPEAAKWWQSLVLSK